MIRHLKLWHFPASRSARVKWMLHETVGEAFETVRVAVYQGQQYEAEFLQRNPNHAVPVLEIGWADGRTQVMIESAAMVAFLADAYPERGLAPPPGATAARADYLQMLHFGSTWVDMMLWQIRVHEHVLPEDERDARTIARYRHKFASEVEPQLRQRLEAGPFICGEAFTAADCVIGHDVTWARGYGLCRDEVFRQYLSRLARRPAFAAAFADAREFTRELPEGSATRTKFTG